MLVMRERERVDKWERIVWGILSRDLIAIPTIRDFVIYALCSMAINVSKKFIYCQVVKEHACMHAYAHV